MSCLQSSSGPEEKQKEEEVREAASILYMSSHTYLMVYMTG